MVSLAHNHHGRGEDPHQRLQFTHRPAITVLGDAGFENLRSLLHAVNDPLYLYQVKAWVTSGNQLDAAVISQLHRLLPSPEGEAISLPLLLPGEGSEEPDPNDTFYHNPATGQIFVYLHARYAATQIGSKKFRDAYWDGLQLAIEATGPSLILMMEFRPGLHPEFARRYANQIVNCSLLTPASPDHEPLGYVIRGVSADGADGPVFFRQLAEQVPHDVAAKLRLGPDEYERYRARAIRTGVMLEQSTWLPKIVQLLGSNLKRTVVKDEAAFRAEGRGDYLASGAWLEERLRAYESWCEKGGGPEATFEEWDATIRKPYERVLFWSDDAWRTLEEILGAPAEVTLPSKIAPRRIYHFELPGPIHTAMVQLERLLIAATDGDNRLTENYQCSFQEGKTIVTIEAAAALDSVLEQNGIRYETEDCP